MALAYLLFYAGLRTAPGSSAAIATLLEPLTAAVLAALLLDERLGAAGVARRRADPGRGGRPRRGSRPPCLTSAQRLDHVRYSAFDGLAVQSPSSGTIEILLALERLGVGVLVRRLAGRPGTRAGRCRPSLVAMPFQAIAIMSPLPSTLRLGLPSRLPGPDVREVHVQEQRRLQLAGTAELADQLHGERQHPARTSGSSRPASAQGTRSNCSLNASAGTPSS